MGDVNPGFLRPKNGFTGHGIVGRCIQDSTLLCSRLDGSHLLEIISKSRLPFIWHSSSKIHLGRMWAMIGIFRRICNCQLTKSKALELSDWVKRRVLDLAIPSRADLN
jgi:hypothetical protein